MEWPAWAVSAWEAVDPWLQKLALWRGYEAELQTLLIYAVGIAAYTMLVFTFYRNLSRRAAFHLTDRPGWAGRTLRFLESVFIFPLMSFLYFGVLALSLFVLAKATQGTSTLLLLSMSVVVGVRVTAFASENAALDLAKLLPLALLGVLLVDPSYASLSTSWGRVSELPSLAPLLGRYFLLFLLLEAVLQTARRILTGTRHAWTRHREKRLRKQDLLAQVRMDHAAGGAKGVVSLTPTEPPRASRPREGPAAAEDEVAADTTQR